MLPVTEAQKTLQQISSFQHESQKLENYQKWIEFMKKEVLESQVQNLIKSGTNLKA